MMQMSSIPAPYTFVLLPHQKDQSTLRSYQTSIARRIISFRSSIQLNFADHCSNGNYYLIDLSCTFGKCRSPTAFSYQQRHGYDGRRRQNGWCAQTKQRKGFFSASVALRKLQVCPERSVTHSPASCPPCIASRLARCRAVVCASKEQLRAFAIGEQASHPSDQSTGHCYRATSSDLLSQGDLLQPIHQFALFIEAPRQQDDKEDRASTSGRNYRP